MKMRPDVAGQPARILIVDDERQNRELLKTILTPEGFVPLLAASGEEALLIVAAEPPQLILLDLMMPGMDGHQVARQIKGNPVTENIPIIMVTALHNREARMVALRAGVEDFLTKPVDRAELTARVKNLLHLKAYGDYYDRYSQMLEGKVALRTAQLLERTNALELQAAALTEQAALLDLALDAIVVRDADSRILSWNHGAEVIYGWSKQEALGKVAHDLWQTEYPEPLESIEASLFRDGQWEGEFIHCRRDGSRLNIASRWTIQRAADGAPIRILTINNDITERRTMALQMAYAAQHDFLTGLPNRMLLNDRINQSIAGAPRHLKPLALLFLDLDGFKHINDSLGHSAGDKLLQSVARRLVGCVRVTDTVSRQGGDEFVVLLSEVERPEDPAIAAIRMLQAVNEAHSIDGHDLHLTTSIGLSIFPDDGLDAETLVKNADTAMYQAKESGRQSFKFFTPAMNVRAVERQSLEEGLRRALERRELSLHYQPQINLRTGHITGAEALIRWSHPTRGAVPPAQFIPVAEDCGLILPIGKWVLREACRQAREWESEGLSVGTMAVNISAVQFRDQDFLDDVFGTLEETGLNPGSLELELTESVLMKHADAAESILKAVRETGVLVALDDFGTGYSSLSYLTQFPIDALKIDQSFVRQITAAPDETSIVVAVIGMARSLRLQVIAEGVETPEELDFLLARHCDVAQGYYFSRPIPAGQFAALLKTGISRDLLSHFANRLVS